MAKNTVTHATSDFKRRCKAVPREQKAHKKFVDVATSKQGLPKKYDNIFYIQLKNQRIRENMSNNIDSAFIRIVLLHVG